MDSEFGRLLQGQIHAVATRNALGQCDTQGRLAGDRQKLRCTCCHQFARNGHQDRAILAAMPVEERHRITFTQSQHGDMPCGLLWKVKLDSAGKGRGNQQSRGICVGHGEQIVPYGLYLAGIEPFLLHSIKTRPLGRQS